MFKPSIPRLSLAMVWMYQGLWLKVLASDPHQRAILEAVPHFTPAAARLALVLIGAAECALAFWILSGRYPRAAAITQTVLLASMNACGILWARREIPDVPGMLLLNFAFLALAWNVAETGLAYADR
jgi:hypothetical protein